MKILQINTFYQYGSTGRIVMQLLDVQKQYAMEGYALYGRKMGEQISSNVMCIESKIGFYINKYKTHVLGKHGFYSKGATKRALKIIDEIKPDVIHFHNLHGHYINIEMLCKYIAKKDIPVVWTIHDCWAFTGHCAYFYEINCEKWKNGCENCPLLRSYPKSMFLDRSAESWKDKKDLFQSVPRLHIVAVSKWLEDLTRQSFLKQCDIRTIYNGVDCSAFYPREEEARKLREKLGLENKKVVLAVASTWTQRKGINDIITIAREFSKDYRIVLIGQIKNIKLEPNIIHIQQISDPGKLSIYYTMADCFVNPSRQETFGLTTAEALACGTPAVVYDVSACGEVIGNDPLIGAKIDFGNVLMMKEKIETIIQMNSAEQSKRRRQRVVDLFDKETQLKKYVELYNEICKK